MTPSIETIAWLTAASFGVSVLDLQSARRDKRTALARHVAFYLVRQMTQHSYPTIARRFGNRDHTTAMHGVQRIAALRQVDADLDETLDGLQHVLTLQVTA